MSPTLLTLPLELRLQIYSYLLPRLLPLSLCAPSSLNGLTAHHTIACTRATLAKAHSASTTTQCSSAALDQSCSSLRAASVSCRSWSGSGELGAADGDGGCCDGRKVPVDPCLALRLVCKRVKAEVEAVGHIGSEAHGVALEVCSLNCLVFGLSSGIVDDQVLRRIRRVDVRMWVVGWMAREAQDENAAEGRGLVDGHVGVLTRRLAACTHGDAVGRKWCVQGSWTRREEGSLNQNEREMKAKYLACDGRAWAPMLLRLDVSEAKKGSGREQEKQLVWYT
jgi:hypothetical protein